MFDSRFVPLDPVPLPAFAGTRVMMMPVRIGDAASLPDALARWRRTFETMSAARPRHEGEIGYLTIDEKRVDPGSSHRRGGPHVDGIYQSGMGSWGGSWGPAGNGMLTVSSHAMCRAWNGTFEGWPGDEGECDHLAAQISPEAGTLFEAGRLYWVDGLCVHESVPATEPVDRQFVRLSLPSSAPWFEGYDVNPTGVLPTGPILSRREQMDA